MLVVSRSALGHGNIGSIGGNICRRPLMRAHMTKFAHCLTLVSLLVAESLVLPPRGTSQESPAPPNVEQPAGAIDSLPFRRGQWGAEFSIDDGMFGLGVLRFRSPRTALVLNASVGASWAETEGLGGGEGPQSETSIFVSVHAGPRRYRPIVTAAAAYVGTGLTGSYSWGEDGNSRRRMWRAGVFGQLGGVYFVTPRFSLGARVEASASFSASRQTASIIGYSYRDRRFSIGLAPVRIVGGLYF